MTYWQQPQSCTIHQPLKVLRVLHDEDTTGQALYLSGESARSAFSYSPSIWTVTMRGLPVLALVPGSGPHVDPLRDSWGLSCWKADACSGLLAPLLDSAVPAWRRRKVCGKF